MGEMVTVMANEQNLKPITSSEEARAKQKKSVEKRYENKIRKGLIADAILDALSEEDLREIARGMIDRAKESSNDLVAMRDTIGEKPVDRSVQANIDAEYLASVEYIGKLLGEEP